MYAVISEGMVVYLGNDSLKAARVLGEFGDETRMVVVETLEGLVQSLESGVEKLKRDDVEEMSDELSDAAQRLFEMLDKADVTVGKIADGLGEQSDKLVAQVQTLGIKSMKVVGDRFIALGDLLRKAAKDDG